MKQGAVLINTSTAAIFNLDDLLVALDARKVGYIGPDIYENEDSLFFDHDEKNNQSATGMLNSIASMPNVVITTNQAYLTQQEMLEIAKQPLKIWIYGRKTNASATHVFARKTATITALCTLNINL